MPRLGPAPQRPQRRLQPRQQRGQAGRRRLARRRLRRAGPGDAGWRSARRGPQRAAGRGRERRGLQHAQQQRAHVRQAPLRTRQVLHGRRRRPRHGAPPARLASRTRRGARQRALRVRRGGGHHGRAVLQVREAGVQRGGRQPQRLGHVRAPVRARAGGLQQPRQQEGQRKHALRQLALAATAATGFVRNAFGRRRGDGHNARQHGHGRGAAHGVGRLGQVAAQRARGAQQQVWRHGRGGGGGWSCGGGVRG
jgi:hypothetical protein